MNTAFPFPTSPRIAMLVACCLLAMPVLAAGEQETAPPVAGLTGSWHGTLDAGQAQLRLIFHVTLDDAGTVGATLDSPDQGAQGIPVATVAQDGDQVTFDLTAIGASFSGTLSADGTQIEGHWHQGGHTLPLVVAHRSEEDTGRESAGD